MAQRLDVQYIRLYTNGSAALKLESAASLDKASTQRIPHKIPVKKIYVDPVAILSIAVAVCMIVLMSVGFAQLHKTRAQVDVMEQYVERLENKNVQLSDQYKSGYNLDQIRQAAYELQMIPKDQAAQVTLMLPAEPEPVEQITLWEQIGMFLAGLFA